MILSGLVEIMYKFRLLYLLNYVCDFLEYSILINIFFYYSFLIV